MRVRDAVRRGVPTADHDDVLAGRGDRGLVPRTGGAAIAHPVRDRAVAVVEVVHREVNALKLRSVHVQRAMQPRADRHDDRAVLGTKLVSRDVDADVHPAPPR